MERIWCTEHLSYDVCLEVKGEISELFCVVLCTEAVHKHTRMSNSYSSLDCVLSHRAHFIVRRLIYMCLSVYFVCFCFILHSCSIVSAVGWI